MNRDLVAVFRVDSLMKEKGSSLPFWRSKMAMVTIPPIKIEWRLILSSQDLLVFFAKDFTLVV